MNENLADEIRKTIESIKDMKVQASGINSHLSTLENLVRKDIMEQVDEAYQRGLEEGKAVNDKGCEGCKYESRTSGENPCFSCARNANDYWTAKQTDDNLDIIRNGIHNWAAELNVKLDDIASILEEMRHD